MKWGGRVKAEKWSKQANDLKIRKNTNKGKYN